MKPACTKVADELWTIMYNIVMAQFLQRHALLLAAPYLVITALSICNKINLIYNFKVFNRRHVSGFLCSINLQVLCRIVSTHYVILIDMCFTVLGRYS